jgi:hypothetical protein
MRCNTFSLYFFNTFPFIYIANPFFVFLDWVKIKITFPFRKSFKVFQEDKKASWPEEARHFRFYMIAIQTHPASTLEGAVRYSDHRLWPALQFCAKRQSKRKNVNFKSKNAKKQPIDGTRWV